MTTPAQRKAAQRYQSKCRQLKLTFTPQSIDVWEWLCSRSLNGHATGSDVIAALRELMKE